MADAPEARSIRRTPTRLPVSLTGLGLGLSLVIAGSFLPWLLSGQVTRNSYQITAIADRLGVLGDGFAGRLVAAWPLMGPICFLPVITGLLRWWRVTGALAVVIGLITAVLSSGVLLVATGKSGAGISLQSTGPVTMLIGGTILIFAGVVLLTVLPQLVQLGTIAGDALSGTRAFE